MLKQTDNPSQAGAAGPQPGAEEATARLTTMKNARTASGNGGEKSRAIVLHVDDDPNDTALLQAATQKADVDFDLKNVEDGEAAIAYLSGTEKYADRKRYRLPSLVLLDLKMPRSTGFEILKWIREHPAFKRLPVIVLSGSELQDDISNAYAAGADSYLVKPLGFEALVNLVKRINEIWLKASGQLA
jgi:CheY-like chemotaxis protein